MAIQSIYVISFLFSHTAVIKWYCCEYDVTGGDEGGRNGGERLQGAADTGRSAVVRTCSYTTGLCC